jgi:hypothetical protein
MRHYCTAFDRHYAVRGLTLYRSLQQHAAPFTLWVLCHDDFTCDLLTTLDLPEVRAVPISDLERSDPALAAARRTRSRIEYYFTCTPAWPLYILEQNPNVASVTYLDADLFFYAAPDPIFDEMSDAPALIVPHRFPAEAQWKEKYGIFNVGLLSFRNDEGGRACLRWWHERCLEWCHDRLDNGRYADQKYLDEWPERFPAVHILKHPGAGLGPWNWMAYDIRIAANSATVEGLPLVFYHFHGLRIFHRKFYDPGVRFAERLPGVLRRWLYGGYVAALDATVCWLAEAAPHHRVTLEDRRHLRISPLSVGKRLMNALASRMPR